MKVCVLSVRNYDFENGNQRVKGTKVSYLIEDRDIDGVRGHSPLIVNVDSEKSDLFKTVPGMYDLEFTMKVGKNNKPELVVKDIKCLNSVDFIQFFKTVK